MTICIDCKIERTPSEFYRRADNGKRLKRCRDCHCLVAKARRKSLPNYDRNRWMKSKYGLTLDQYRAMFEAQAGACAMCKRRSERSLSVDHDHVTNTIRALLCVSCNALIGFAQEDVLILQEAINYIMKYNIGYQKQIAKPIESQSNA